MKLILTILIFLIGFNSLAINLTYYVSNAGNDANTGTSAGSPWRTIAKVNSFLHQAGDHILFNRGDTWHEAIRISRNGTAGNPIVYSAYGTGANPVITGFVSVTSWTNLGANIWESTSSVSGLNDLNLVVINGVNTAMGRIPNTGYYPYQSASSVSPWTITSTSTPSATTNWTGADLILRHNNFIETRDLILSHSGNTITYQSTVPAEIPRANFGFFIENDVRTLDAQNEWYYNPISKKIRIYSTSAPTGVQISTLDTLAYMVAHSNITFDGIDFTGSNRRAFFIGSCSNITIQNCNFNFHGIYVVWGGNNFGVSSNNFRFYANTVNHTGGQAIDIQNEFTNAYIGYNTFKNTGVIPGMFKIPAMPFSRWDQAYGAVKTNKTNGLHVEYNSFDSSGYTQIHFTGNNTRINNNYCQNWELILMDGGAIYTWTGPGTPTNYSLISDNILVNATGTLVGTNGAESTPLVHGIYTDDNTANTQIVRNSVANVPHSGFYIHQTHESLIRDNTSYNNGQNQALFEYRDYQIRNDTSKNNIWFAKTLTQSTAQFQSIDNTPAGIGDIPQFFTSLDSNYYTKPIDEVSTPANSSPVEVNLDNTNFHHYTLPQWKTFISPFDANSTKAPKAVTHTDSLRFEYNATSAPVVIPLPYNYIDVRNVAYNGTITLQPYTSAVLIQDGPVTGGGNILPVTNAGADQVIQLPTTSVTLSGSATDADGTISSYLWTQISGPSSTITSPASATTTVTAMNTAGTYVYQLQSTDNSGGVSIDQIEITVNSSNISPVASAGTDQTFNQGTSSTTLNGSGSDADGVVITYAWTQTAGPAATIVSLSSATTNITGLNTATTYTFLLTVTDNLGATHSDAVNIVVTPIVPPGTIQNFIITKQDQIYRPIL